MQSFAEARVFKPMQRMIRHTYYVILGVFIATAALTVAGLAYTWFSPGPARAISSLAPTPASPSPAASAVNTNVGRDETSTQPTGEKKLPYLGPLVTALLFEAIAIVFIFVRSGLKYLPKVKVHKTEPETFEFMAELLNFGTSVTIVSNRLSLLTRSDIFQKAVKQKAENGTKFEFITRTEVPDADREPLERLGAVFYVTRDANPPQARFTLINAHRAGGETLAIARGTHPAHEITVFDANSGPQMIAMAKDIIQKSKEVAANAG